MASDDSVRGRVLAKLRNYFLTGLLVTAPIGVTVALVWWLVNYVDQVVIPLIPDALNPDVYFKESFGIEGGIPGLGLIIVVVTLTLVGALAAGILGRWLLGLSESILNRMPVVRSLYSAVKQLLETIVRDQSQTFNNAVLVQYPRPGVWAVAFVTTETKGELKRRLGGGYVNVFLPTTPNPTSGFLLFVPREEVIELDMSVEEAVKMVISAGIVTPDEHLSGAERILAGKMTHSQLEERLYGQHDEEPSPDQGAESMAGQKNEPPAVD